MISTSIESGEELIQPKLARILKDAIGSLKQLFKAPDDAQLTVHGPHPTGKQYDFADKRCSVYTLAVFML